MELPNVKNVNKGKRKLKKHQFKVNDMVAYKWYGEREIGYISECYVTKEGWAAYKVRSVSKPGCIYSDMELDDPDDPYCYISSVLTKSMTGGERELVLARIEKSKNRFPQKPVEVVQSVKPVVKSSKPVVKSSKPVVADSVEPIDKTELKKAVQKQKDFINGNFW